MCLALPVAGSSAALALPAVIDKPQLISTGGVQGGLVIHLGCTDEELLAAFAKDPRFVAQGLARNEGVVRKLRSALEPENLYGSNVSVIQLADAKLPYNDQLAEKGLNQGLRSWSTVLSRYLGRYSRRFPMNRDLQSRDNGVLSLH